ncbi:MAG: DEAD/DEAH box helicase [Planctomycetota bacterium]|jgi:ATP-dependent RNA helicase DeaD
MKKKSVPGFEDLGLSKKTLAAVRKAGFELPSPIQAEFIPVAVNGNDCIGQAHTGTGKTASFVIPILERIDLTSKRPQALILTPTRELSEQVANEARKLSANREDCRVACIVGGKSIKTQVDQIKRGAQILVGTPGRIIDMMGRRHFDPQTLDVVVLDEADRMLDIGFRPDIEKILRQCPTERQTLLLSATMPPPVERLARRFMNDPEMVDLSQDEVASRDIRQFYVTVDKDRKFETLVRLLAQEQPKQALVFTRTKRGADQLHGRFVKRLPDVAQLHGDLPQRKRDRVMKDFRAGKVRLMIATDVVGRGIDISGISHIINYDIPEFCDDYVHRIGRTGRMSSDTPGCAFTFVTREQGGELTRIEVRINKLIEPYEINGFEAARPKKQQAAVVEAPRSFG